MCVLVKKFLGGASVGDGSEVKFNNMLRLLHCRPLLALIAYNFAIDQLRKAVVILSENRIVILL